MITQINKMGLHYFRQALHERIELYELRHREKHRDEMSDENITRFIENSKSGIYRDLDTLRKKLVGAEITNDLQNEIDKVVHYFWAELVERLSGLGDGDALLFE